MFVAVLPPEEVRDEIEEFLSVRSGMPWIDRDQWHFTLAFLESVPDHRVDELIEELERAALRHKAFDLAVAGGGCFPSVERAAVLWLGGPGLSISLADSVRGAANSVGATPDGRGFVPHLTVARLRHRVEATKWLRVLDTFRSRTWRVDSVSLVASYLHEGPAGRPRYETVAELPLAT